MQANSHYLSRTSLLDYEYPTIAGLVQCKQWMSIGEDTYILRTAITEDLGVYASPDDYCRDHPAKVSGLEAWPLRSLFLRIVNGNVQRTRAKAGPRLAHAQ
ncbi:MAG: hypothetical protein ACR2RL_12185 [Gammaproteobacteria bacterium]